MNWWQPNFISQKIYSALTFDSTFGMHRLLISCVTFHRILSFFFYRIQNSDHNNAICLSDNENKYYWIMIMIIFFANSVQNLKRLTSFRTDSILMEYSRWVFWWRFSFLFWNSKSHIYLKAFPFSLLVRMLPFGETNVPRDELTPVSVESLAECII